MDFGGFFVERGITIKMRQNYKILKNIYKSIIKKIQFQKIFQNISIFQKKRIPEY